MLLNEYEIEFVFRKIRNILNLGNVLIRGPHIVMSRTDAQNGLDFPFKYLLMASELIAKRYKIILKISCPKMKNFNSLEVCPDCSVC
jgi:hypothetical protein